jgi:hypothetical protein
MPQISKELVKDLIATLDAYGCGAHHPDLLPLLDQPEDEPVAWRRFDDTDVAWHVELTTNDDYDDWQPLYTHPAPFTPITADDVTDEMLVQVHKANTEAISGYSEKLLFANVVNTYMGAKK